jgi:hypothetical protein
LEVFTFVAPVASGSRQLEKQTLNRLAKGQRKGISG